MRQNPYRRLAAMPQKASRQSDEAMAGLLDPATFTARERLNIFGKPGPLEDYERYDFVPVEFDGLVDTGWLKRRYADLKRVYVDVPDLRWESALPLLRLTVEDVEETLRDLERESRHVANSRYGEYFPDGGLGEPDRTHPDWDYFAERYTFDEFLKPALDEVRADVARLEAIRRNAQHLLDWHARSTATYRASRKELPEGGEVWPPDVDPVETMFHVTTAYRAILDEGFKTQEQLGKRALGLGGHVEGISFTASRELAEGIEYAMRALKDCMGGPRTVSWMHAWAKRHGMPEADWAETLKYSRSAEPVPKDPDERMKVDPAQALFRRTLGKLDALGLVYDPLFFAVPNIERFGDLDDRDIGIIEAKIDMTAPGLKHLSAMEEWRVPIRAIIEYKGIT